MAQICFGLIYFHYFCRMKSGNHIAPIERNTRPSWLCGGAVIGFVLVAFGVLNFLTPEYHDDFVYKFMFEGGSVNYDHPIKNFGEIFASQIEHYKTVNGRSIVHFLVQLFTGLLGKSVFNIFNVLVFGLFIWLLNRPFNRAAGTCHRLTGLALSLVLVLLMPRYKDTFLWMTGSINYLWSATAALVFLFMYEKREAVATGIKTLPLIVAAFLLGWTHEGITFPLAVALLCNHFFNLRKNHGKGQGLWLILAYLAGGCVIALAPGTIARSGMSGTVSATTIGLKVIAGLSVLGKLRIVYLALLVSGIAWFRHRDIVKRVMKRDGYLLLAALLACGIVMISGLESTRTAFGVELFSLIYLLRLASELIPLMHTSAVRWCGIGLAIGLMAFYGLLLRHTIPSWQESQRLIAQIERTEDGIIPTNEHHAGRFSSFICTMLSPDSTVNAMNYDPHGWPLSIAATYQRDSLVFLPQAFLEDLQKHPERYENLDRNPSFEFFVQRIDGQATINGVEFLLAPNDFSDVPFYFRPIAKRMNRYTDTTVSTDKWATIWLYGQRYLLIKRDHTLDKRLTDIHIITQTEEITP
jgi:hypothetical protein